MAGTDQPDDNETEMQTDLFAAEPVPAYRPDPERVRARLHKILAEAIPSAAAGEAVMKRALVSTEIHFF
jgi:hypothetical protein